MKKKLNSLTLSRLEEIFQRAKLFTGCEVCHRKAKYLYFYDGVPLGETCGLHRIKELKK